MDFYRLKKSYSSKKNEIANRLEDFRQVSKDDDSLYKELVFCLMTPQSSAKVCDKVLSKLDGWCKI